MATTPEHAFPTKFSIGFRRTEPFVDITQLEAHLALLNELAELRSLVDRWVISRTTLTFKRRLRARSGDGLGLLVWQLKGKRFPWIVTLASQPIAFIGSGLPYGVNL